MSNKSGWETKRGTCSIAVLVQYAGKVPHFSVKSLLYYWMSLFWPEVMPQTRRKFVKQLFEQYHQELHAYLVSRLRGDALDATDVSQETFLRLLRLKDTKVIEQPHAYVYSVAAHVVRELGLKEQSQASLPGKLGDEALAAEPPDLPMDEAGRLARLEQLQRCINDMPPTYQAILLMRKRDGMTYQEIAERLEISVHTVKKYLLRAVAWCRQYEQQQNGGAA